MLFLALRVSKSEFTKQFHSFPAQIHVYAGTNDPRYILEEQNLRLLLFLWPGLLCVGLLVVEMLSRRLLRDGELSLMKKHLLRKSFHLLAICLFAPPLLTGQGEFLALAQLVAALLFIALEVCRACRAPLCHIQDRFLSKYLDKREDRGSKRFDDLIWPPTCLTISCIDIIYYTYILYTLIYYIL